MSWFNLPKWSDDDDNRDITQLDATRQQHQTNASLPNNEDDALVILRAENAAMNKQDDIVDSRKN
jgi:hypothetical protein